MVHQFARIGGRLRARVGHDDGQTIVEYALILALIAFTLMVALNALALDIGAFMQTMLDAIS